MMQDDFIANLVDDSTPVSPVNVTKNCCKLVLGLGGYLLALLLVLGVRDDWAMQMTSLAYSLEMAITLLLVFGAGLSAVRLSVPSANRMIDGWGLMLLAVTMGAIIWFIGKVDVESMQQSLSSNHFYVTLGVSLIAVPVAVGLFWMIRKGAPTQLEWAGVMALLSASACGHFVMRTAGKAENLADVMLWCYPPVLLLALVGIILGPKALRW